MATVSEENVTVEDYTNVFDVMSVLPYLNKLILNYYLIQIRDDNDVWNIGIYNLRLASYHKLNEQILGMAVGNSIKRYIHFEPISIQHSEK